MPPLLYIYVVTRDQPKRTRSTLAIITYLQLFALCGNSRYEATHPTRHNRMAPRAMRSAVGLAMAVVAAAALCSRASAQAGGCAPLVVNLSPCVAYLTGNSSAPPPATCCTQLDNVVQTQMACLCMFLANGSPFRIPVNQTQALALPGACNIKAGPLGQCNGVGTTTPPAASPPAPVAPGPASPVTPSAAVPGVAPSASVSPNVVPVTPSTPNAPSGSGSKVVPGTQVGGGSSTALRTHPLFFCFLMAVASFVPGVVGF